MSYSQNSPDLGDTSSRQIKEQSRSDISDIEILSRVFDTAVKIPLINKRVGIDPIIGLVPVFGDLLSGTVSAYILYRAAALGVRKRKLFVILKNIIVDSTVGAVPLLGDLFDFGFQANKKNLALIQKELSNNESRDSYQVGRLLLYSLLSFALLVPLTLVLIISSLFLL